MCYPVTGTLNGNAQVASIPRRMNGLLLEAVIIEQKAVRSLTLPIRTRIPAQETLAVLIVHGPHVFNPRGRLTDSAPDVVLEMMVMSPQVRAGQNLQP